MGTVNDVPRKDLLERPTYLGNDERAFSCKDFRLETVQDFLIKLGIKPLMYLLEISIFSLNNVIIRLTKIMNRATKQNKSWAHF